MKKKIKYAPREIVDSLINQHYENVFCKNPNIEYLASVPKDIDQPSDEEYYIEIGVTDFGSLKAFNYIPIIKNDNGYQIPKKWIDCLKDPHSETIKLLHFENEFPNQISDSVLVKPFHPQTHINKEVPLCHGINIGNQYQGFGTLGALMQFEGSDSVFVISNHHVLSGTNYIKDRCITQPGKDCVKYGFHPRDIIAQVKLGHYGNYVDVAFAKLFSIKSVPKTYLDTDIPLGIDNPKDGDYVYKIGAKTGKMDGRVRSTNAYFRFELSSTSTKIKTLKKQILLTKISEDGDSGSIVVNSKTKMAIGLLMGGDNHYYSVANQFKYIFHTTPKLYPHLPPLKFKKFV